MSQAQSKITKKKGAQEQSSGDSSSPLKAHLVRTFAQTQFGLKFVGENVASVGITQESIEDAIYGYAESVKIGMKIIDELAKIHPFIAGPLLAFKFVANLELKRRDNNQKVLAVHAQMQDLICAIVDACDKVLARNEVTGVSLHLKDVLKNIETDIMACSSFCEVYENKSFMRKLLKSSKYNAILTGHMSRFLEYRDEFQRTLVNHSTIRLEDLHDKFDTMRAEFQSHFNDLFKLLESKKEREAETIMADAGGPMTCVADLRVLKNLVDKTDDNSFHKSEKELTSKGSSKSDPKGASSEITIQDIQNILQQELNENLDERQGDRIASYFYGGHERIINPHLRAIWKEMGWRGSVKAVDFVFALWDYISSSIKYQDGKTVDQLEQHAQNSSPTPSNMELPAIDFQMNPEDEWTKEYINISNLQSISECIDDDGSGFINIHEVNRFTLNCPKHWSFLQWLAYWAAGWHISLAGKARPHNRMPLHYYLASDGILGLDVLLMSTKNWDGGRYDLNLRNLVRDRMEHEETRIKLNLSRIGYNLDSADTVQLVCGQGRGKIEKHIYPLIYTLLEEHIKRFQLARVHILDEDELIWCSSSLENILQAFDIRQNDLKVIILLLIRMFLQMHINPEAQFENFAFSMFKSSGTTFDRQKSTFHSIVTDLNYYEGNEEVEDCPPDLDKKILKYEPQEPFDLAPNNEEEDIFQYTNKPYGTLNGFCIKNEKQVYHGLLRLSIDRPGSGSSNITGSANTYLGNLVLTGVYLDGDSNNLEVDFTLSYKVNEDTEDNEDSAENEDGEDMSNEENKDSEDNKDNHKDSNKGQRHNKAWIRCTGRVSSNLMLITGNWIASDDAVGGAFHFSRTPADLVRFRYSEVEILENPSRARWKFALNSVVHDVQRRMMSKKFVFERLHQVLRFKDLMVKFELQRTEYREEGSGLNEKEMGEFHKFEKCISPFIHRFIYILAKFLARRSIERGDALPPINGYFSTLSNTYTNNLSGSWNGFCMKNETQVHHGLFQIDMEEVGTTDITGYAYTYIGKLLIAGSYDNSGSVNLLMMYEDSDEQPLIKYMGNINLDITSITGSWSISDSEGGSFLFTKTPAEFVKFRYSEQAYQKNSCHARWKFAIDSVIYDVQRRRMSRGFVVRRLHEMMRFKTLMVKYQLKSNNYSVKGRSEFKAQEVEELCYLEKNISPSINSFIYDCAYFIVSRLLVHYIYCDNCRRWVSQSRIACITCRNAVLNGVDFCLGCIDTTGDLFEDFTHDASHSLVLSDFPIHDFDYGWIMNAARKQSERIKSLFRSIGRDSEGKGNSTQHVSAGGGPGPYCGQILSPAPGLRYECLKPISLPCWVKLNENYDIFVCDTCYEMHSLPPLPQKITCELPTNLLLRIRNSEIPKVVERDRLIRALDERLKAVKQNMDRVLERTEKLQIGLVEHASGIVEVPEEPTVAQEIRRSTTDKDADGLDFEKRLGVLEQRMEEHFSAMEAKYSDLMSTLLSQR
ncbi:hypothetical protein BDQ17DRAFT_1438197 [Cyathus striatus]|nr:hypothetical protein BDQ17DRAFT_1438197 [Cyathus striatus]